MNSSPKGRAMSPARFAELASGGAWACKPHNALMNQRAMMLVRGKIDRHITLEPPQTGKSEFWSLWFPTWLIGSYPETRVLLGSYNSDYAAEWGQKVRDNLDLYGEEFFGVRLRPDRKAVNNWGLLGHRGGMRTFGLDAGITGHAADVFLVDDPVKNWEEAYSPTTREKIWKNYASSIESRVQPDGFVSVVMTPWHEDDLGGRLLTRLDDRYHVLRMPALAEEPVPAEKRATRKGYYGLMGAPDPLGRPPGAALWPARYDEKHYAAVKRMEPSVFESLYQCSPRAADGEMFKRDWFTTIRSTPSGGSRVRYWDRAATQGGGDYTVGVLMALVNGKYYVEHVVREQVAAAEVHKLMLRTAREDHALYPFGVEVWVEQEPGSSGKESAEAIRKTLVGFDVRTETVSGNKESRARPFANAAEGKDEQGHPLFRLCLDDEKKYRHWDTEAFLDELTGFPKGRHDDQVDAASGAFAKLALGGDAWSSATAGDEDLVEMEGYA